MKKVNGSVFRASNIVLLNSIHLLRCVSTCYTQNAGFQGLNLNMPLELKLKQIERKKLKIQRMERKALEPIPITDFYIPYSWKTLQRKRKMTPLTESTIERRALLEKEWVRFVSDQHQLEEKKTSVMVNEQVKALIELRLKSDELYEAALQPDLTILPFKCTGPIETLQLKDYLMPLGSYILQPAPFSTDQPIAVKADLFGEL
uniref:Large ribosomal subunit protein mL40 n=1 Tax=Ciona savignyi TaxID=51511 RepID=H2YB54_CIOSA